MQLYSTSKFFNVRHVCNRNVKSYVTYDRVPNYYRPIDTFLYQRDIKDDRIDGMRNVGFFGKSEVAPSVSIDTKEKTSPGLILGYMVEIVILIYFLVVLGNLLFRSNPLSSLKLNNTKQTTSDVTFDDVAGLGNAKTDIQEIVDFLKYPEKFDKVGARVPRGALLVGPPGCGKTLLARAVAGEANVPFFSCSASEMIQMFVGVGASRVRDLFKEATKKVPSIIFIDEIDAIGKVRGQGILSNDEREQTINQLLTEMDGFKGNQGVIVLAATNRVDVLDPALLRPGRFDRQISVEYPNLKERTSILDVHLRDKPLSEDFDSSYIARYTTGFSGAQLANLCNEASIYAARNDSDVVTMKYFDDAYQKVVIGEKRDITISDEKKELIAYHEAGHAFMAVYTDLYHSVRTVSIIPRGQSGGVTIFQPREDDVDMKLYSRSYLESQIAIALGGRIAEELKFGHSGITVGASSDLQSVENIARAMVSSYSLSDMVPMSYNYETVSDSTKFALEAEMARIVSTVYSRSRQIMYDNMRKIDNIAKVLMEYEVIDANQLLEAYDD